MKNISTDRRDRILFYQKIDWKFYMRTSCIYVIVLLGTASVIAARPTSGQGLEQEVTIGMEHESAKVLLEKIEAATSFRFVFKTTVIDINDISFPSKLRSIRETLNLGFEKSPVSFYLNGENIIITGKTGIEPIKGQMETDKEMKDIGDLVPISGIVKDRFGQPLPGVNIIVKGTTIGTSTDAEGKFVIDVPDGSESLIFSFIGLKTVEVILAGRSTFEVEMEADITTLEEVVVNGGYYTTTDRMRIGSIVKVTAREIENQPVTNPLMSLQGRVPGLDITPTSGTPGSSVKVQIRGRNSLRINSANEVVNSPLYVIDGIPIDPSPLRSGANTLGTVANGYDPLSAINPSNIESIEVLKDADATAIYGSRGANGVILITTKRGTKKGTTGLDVNFYSGVGKVLNMMDLLNTEQYLLMRREALVNDNVPVGPQDYDLNGTWDTTRYTNWQKELLGGTASINDIQAGISGGDERMSFRFNGGYHKETTVYPGNFGFELYSGQLSVDHTSLDNRLRASFSVNYGFRKSRVFEQATFINQILQLAPNAPALYNEDGSLNWAVINVGTGQMSTFDNPLAKLRNTNEMSEGNLMSSADLNYNIVDGLTLKSNFGYANVNSDELIKQPINSLPPVITNAWTTGSARFGTNKRRSIIIEPQIVYRKNIQKHKLDFLVGGTWQQSESVYQLLGAGGYTSDFLMNSTQAATSTVMVADVDNRFKYCSFYFRAGYNLSDRYLVSLTGRRDGSSRFGPGKRFGNFGSIGVAWIFSNERVIKNSNFLSYGKIRSSTGVTGNDQIGDYRFMDTYTLSSYRYQDGINLIPSQLYNPEFSWEETKKLEGAVELGFFKDRIFVEVDWYRNRSDNQLVNYSLPSMTGFDFVFQNFPAVVQNSGVEALVRIASLRREVMTIMTSFNVSINKNKLIEFPGIETSSYNRQYKVGEPLNLRILYTYKGIDSKTGLYAVEDFSGDGRFTVDDTRLMNPVDRSFFGGITNTVVFRSLEVQFTFQFSKQRKAGYAIGLPPGTRNINMPVEVLDRWQEEGDVAKFQKFSQAIAARQAMARYNVSDGNTVDASFIRLKTFTLSYILPQSWTKKIYIDRAKCFLQGQNLFTITDYKGLDPETETSLPPLRVLSWGVSLQF